MKLNNRGVTLVEMIVAFAILGVVSIAIFGFMLTSTKTYTRLSVNTKTQYEAQLAMGSIEKRIMSCSKGIAWNSGQKALFVLNEGDTGEVLEVIYLDSSTNQLYYGSGANNTSMTYYLLAEHVTAMNVSLTQKSGKVTKASITVTMERNGKTFTENKTVALRAEPKYCTGQLAGTAQIS